MQQSELRPRSGVRCPLALSNMKTVPRACAVLSVLLFPVGCASYTGPGIQKKEALVLERSYYWKAFGSPVEFSDARIERLFVRSLDESLDGEYAELHLAQLVWALAAVGDKQFADLLSRQPVDVQRATLHTMSSVWSKDKLHYPLTERLAKQ